MELISLHPDEEELIQQSESLNKAIDDFLEEINVPATKSITSVKNITSSINTEWIYESLLGDEQFLYCKECHYQANLNAAQFCITSTENEAAKPLKKVATPECPTIESLADFLGVPQSHTAKAVFLVASILNNKPPEEKLAVSYTHLRAHET